MEMLEFADSNADGKVSPEDFNNIITITAFL
jgi:hypothetical protein